jgi:hypothetical protein
VIGETRSGSSFRGLTHYLLHGSGENRKSPEWLELRNLARDDPDRAWRDMERVASQNGRVKEPVFHIVLSPAPGDELTRQDWLALADRVLSDLGLEEHQALVVLHTDTDHPHLHLAVNRVHPMTLRAWATWKSKTRLEGSLRRIEREWGLRVVPGRLAGADRSSRETAAPPLTSGEQAQLHHRASEPQVLTWRRELREAFEEATSWTDLAARLQVNGVHLVARGRGMVLTDGESYVKLSRLDRAWSRPRLEARFGQGFAEWRKEMRHFQLSARLYPRYAARAPHHRRAGAALRTLRRTGKKLGWRALRRLHGPWAPAVASAALAARRRGHLLDQGEQRSWNLFARRHLRPALGRARSWAEVESRLALYGAWLAPADGRPDRLVVTDGHHASPLEDLGAGSRLESLEGRFGSWREWERERRGLLAAARRLHRAEERGDPGDRSRRLTGLIRASERRVSDYERLRDEFRRAEGRLRTLLRHETGRTDTEVLDMLTALRSTPPDQVDRFLLSQRTWQRRLGHRSEGRSRVLDAARAYVRLSARVARAFPPARSAARRLDRLRHQAMLRSPHRLRQRQREILLAAARPLLGAGLGSLLARAAPGLGPALAVSRLLVRLHRGLSRDEDRSRG